MYLTEDILNEVLQNTAEHRNKLGHPKRKKRNKYAEDYEKAYTSYETDCYILDTYIILICTRLKKLLEKGNYSIGRVVKHIRSMDWDYYSGHYAYQGEQLKLLIGMRYKKETPTFYISVQTRYLERASESVAQMLESYEW